MDLRNLIKNYSLEEIRKMTKKEALLINFSYDGMCFLGEVNGTDFITYEKLLKSLKSNNFYELGILSGLGNDEETGGNWLKFMDTKYKRNGKNRFFYVSKKPVSFCLSKVDIFNAGCLYGLDTLKDNGDIDPRSKVAEYYRPRFLEIDKERFIVRLLNGAGNFGTCINKQEKIEFNNINSSEWYRTILPITRAYRFGSTTFNMEEHENLDLRQGKGESMKKRVYDIELAKYDWFKDLNLGPEKSKNSLLNAQGQYNWVQENLIYSHKNSAALTFGGGKLTEGACSMNGAPDILKNPFYGFRPVLELVY